MIGSLLVLVAAVALFFGPNHLVQKHFLTIQTRCRCICALIHGGWPETGEFLSGELLRGETLEKHPWWISGSIVCLRPEESDPAGRIETLQRAVTTMDEILEARAAGLAPGER